MKIEKILVENNEIAAHLHLNWESFLSYLILVVKIPTQRIEMLQDGPDETISNLLFIEIKKIFDKHGLVRGLDWDSDQFDHGEPNNLDDHWFKLKIYNEKKFSLKYNQIKAEIREHPIILHFENSHSL
ncbi:MAG: hypothetical protein ACTSRG_03415 [Candidatus Helarchaeota archaeon]